MKGVEPMETRTFHRERFETPTGRMVLLTDDQGSVHALDWEDHHERTERLLGRYYRNVALELREASEESAAKRALLAYFSGRLEAIEKLRVATSGTEFQNQVWIALRRIPRGKTLSYGALAQTIGRPAAVRAVGLANGANPIAIIVPCHRVIGANASLTGYGGGIERKRWLLDHESARASSKRGRAAEAEST
ncbi:MAG TPA: methylated-DNA--[protein]-cysteine S-methyltransferase [Polyangiaceae bacterium]|nr:methylated-DNA--[protein]-cysteine S-methyltransferase [Polyangiaceae bacterium]